MRIYDAGKIITGLLIFLALVTLPFWFNAVSGKSSHVPDPQIAPDTPRCVRDKDYMKANHMDLLNKWRNQVVRRGERKFMTADGRQFDMSFSRTCLKCHANQQKFCAQCHDYAAVKLYCWDCHVEPGTIKKGSSWR
ncbi:MAG: sulfate reduction electron transfer complex DsrMKJOP subunit DsrJ [Elusimicrobia bacterium]|nr:sulfate reduction electron transfer complex DsrMKJOP subunit DsrJ [Elusimicrobiota bacterium]